jgi:hypothetical protein
MTHGINPHHLIRPQPVMKTALTETARRTFLDAADALIEEAKNRDEDADSMGSRDSYDHEHYYELDLKYSSELRKRARELRSHAKNLKDIVALWG